MIRRLFIVGIEILAVVVIVVAAVLGWASYYIDTPEFRARFANVAEQVVGVPVVLEGELNIALYPVLSLEIVDLVLQGGPEFDNQPLVSFDNVKVSIRLMPFLSRKLEVRSAIVEGMDVSIVRLKDDRINWQAVLDRQEAASALVEGDDAMVDVSFSELDVKEATIAYVDEKDGQSFKLSGINLRTGAIASGAVIPFTARSHFVWKNGSITSEFVLKGMVSTEENGDVFLRDSTLYASVGGDFLPEGANPGEMVSRLVVDMNKRSVALDGLRIRFLGLSAEGELETGDLDKEVSGYGRLKINQFKPSDVIGRYFPEAPIKSVKGLDKGELEASFSFDESGVSVKEFKAVLDDLAVTGGIFMKDFASPAFSFNLTGGMVDLDRYLPLFRTDTPFIWDDFALPFFRSVRAKGTVRANGFKVLDIPISDVHLNVAATSKGIAADATAVRDGQGKLLARADFRIGSAGAGVSTFGADLEFATDSPETGFDFLNIAPLSVTGKGRLAAKVHVADMDCPPEVESIGILKHVSGETRVTVGDGRGEYAPKKGDSFGLTYSNAEGNVKWDPAVFSEGYYGFNVETSLKMAGDPRIRAASLSLSGPLAWNVDDNNVRSDGLLVRSNCSGNLYTDTSSRLAVQGTVGFDAAKGEASVTGGNIRTLETAVRGDARFTGLGKVFKGSGTLSVPGANIRRIVYLLNKFRFRMSDPEALKQLVLNSRFSVDKDGFKLDELKGSLDGMPISGHIYGQGFLEPKLVLSLTGGKLDIDRFIPPDVEPTPEERRAGKEPPKDPPVDLPLAFLRWLNASGKVWLEEFKIADVRAQGVSGNIKTDRGAVNLFGIKGTVHGGALKAGWVADVGEKSMTTHLKLHIDNMEAGPLLKEMADREYVRGLTDVDIDLKSSGTTDDDIVRNLDGKTWARVTNGSFKFTGYDASSRSRDTDDDRMGYKPQNGTRDRRTTFRRAAANFTVEKGVFTVDSFRVEAPPLLQSYGRGNFSLPDNTIDLAIRNDFVAVPSVTLQISGKLSDPKVSVPTGKIVNETVRNILSLPEKSFKFLRDLFQ